MKFDLEIETRLGLRRNRTSQPLRLAIILIAPLYGKLVILKKYPLLRILFHSRWVFDLAAVFYRTSASWYQSSAATSIILLCSFMHVSFIAGFNLKKNMSFALKFDSKVSAPALTVGILDRKPLAPTIMAC